MSFISNQSTFWGYADMATRQTHDFHHYFFNFKQLRVIFFVLNPGKVCVSLWPTQPTLIPPVTPRPPSSPQHHQVNQEPATAPATPRSPRHHQHPQLLPGNLPPFQLSLSPITLSQPPSPIFPQPYTPTQLNVLNDIHNLHPHLNYSFLYFQYAPTSMVRTLTCF